jgi:predicted N-acetyltransferase YhbS
VAAERIRRAELQDYERIHRLLDDCFGKKRDFFRRDWTHVYSEEAFEASQFFLFEVGGRAVGHLALTPLEVHVGDAVVAAGGIGGVGTLPAFRGGGVMSRLLRHAIDEMNSRRIPLSLLGGDRLRYGRFGWEAAGEQLELALRRRYLNEAWDGGYPLRRVSAEQGGVGVEAWYRHGPCWIRRNTPALHLAREPFETWIGADGYACGKLEGARLVITELFSAQGRELELICAATRSVAREEASVLLPPSDPRASALLERTVRWRVVPNYMFRINSQRRLVDALLPELSRRLGGAGARPFDLTLVVRGPEEKESIRFVYQSGKLELDSGAGGSALEIPWRDWTRIVAGGPVVEGLKLQLGELAPAFAAGIYIRELDKV